MTLHQLLAAGGAFISSSPLDERLDVSLPTDTTVSLNSASMSDKTDFSAANEIELLEYGMPLFLVMFTSFVQKSKST